MIDQRGNIARAVDKATANGHDMVDTPAQDEQAPGVFAVCTACNATLRYYKGLTGGEAYQTMCIGVHEPTVTTEPLAVAPAYREPASLRTDEERKANRAETYANATLNDWRDMVLAYADEKGWLTRPEDANVGDMIALMHTELSEAYEEYRNGHEPDETYYTDEHPHKPEGVPSEIIDVIYRALHFCAIFSIDADAMFAEKHEYNLTRPYRHGGKRT